MAHATGTANGSRWQVKVDGGAAFVPAAWSDGARSGREERSDGAEVLLVADRTRGTTHKFFRNWRFEAIVSSGRTSPGANLVAVPLDARTVAASGWHYDLVQLDERPGLLAPGAAAFAWAATNAPATTDPLATGAGEVRAWLVAHDWEEDPAHPGRYHR